MGVFRFDKGDAYSLAFALQNLTNAFLGLSLRHQVRHPLSGRRRICHRGPVTASARSGSRMRFWGSRCDTKCGTPYPEGVESVIAVLLRRVLAADLGGVLTAQAGARSRTQA